MLVLTRKLDEKIMIGDQVEITVLKIRNNQIRLGIQAPRDVRVLRGELSDESSNEVSGDGESIIVELESDETPPKNSTSPQIFTGKVHRRTGMTHLESSPADASSSPLGQFFTAP